MDLELHLGVVELRSILFTCVVLSVAVVTHAWYRMNRVTWERIED
jgi:hypothetical protein